MRMFDEACERLDAVRKLHAPAVSSLVGVIDDDGEREVDPDSFEGIVNRQLICESCAHYPKWPCTTAQALWTEDQIRAVLDGGES